MTLEGLQGKETKGSYLTGEIAGSSSPQQLMRHLRMQVSILIQVQTKKKYKPKPQAPPAVMLELGPCRACLGRKVDAWLSLRGKRGRAQWGRCRRLDEGASGH